MNDQQFDALLSALNGIATELGYIRINLGDINLKLDSIISEESDEDDDCCEITSVDEYNRGLKSGLHHRAPSDLPEDE